MHTPMLTRLVPAAPPSSWPVYPAAIVFAMLGLAGAATMQLGANMPAPLSALFFIAGLWFAVSGTLGAAIWLIFGRAIFRD